MRILITNNRLAKRTGTELYVFELALELLARGHQPAVFTPQAGALAEQLRSRTVPVVDRLAALKATPEIIHGHHREPLLLASMRFPQVPAVFVCHSWNSPDDLPLKLPNLARFVAVDEACRDRLIYEGGIPADATQLVGNFANTRRFRPRGPLPSRPKRALLFTNRAAIGSFPRALAKGCARRGVKLDTLRSIAGKQCETPEHILPDYDIVFARGKAAIEALAVGNAVILCDRKGLGPMVTSSNLPQLRRWNFGRRSFVKAVATENVARAIADYSSDDARAVSEAIRRSSPLEAIVDEWLAIYQAVADDCRPREVEWPSETLRIAAEHLESLSPTLAMGRKAERRRAVFSRLRRLLRSGSKKRQPSILYAPNPSRTQPAA